MKQKHPLAGDSGKTQLFRADPGETQNPCHSGSPSNKLANKRAKASRPRCPDQTLSLLPLAELRFETIPPSWVLGAVVHRRRAPPCRGFSSLLLGASPLFLPPFFLLHNRIASPGGRVLGAELSWPLVAAACATFFTRTSQACQAKVPDARLG